MPVAASGPQTYVLERPAVLELPREAPPGNLPAIAPPPPELDVAGKGRVVADTDALKALVLAREAHLLFDRHTAAFGETKRLPLSRWWQRHGDTVINGGFLLSVGAAAVTMGFAFALGDPGSIAFARTGGLVGIGTAFAGAVAAATLKGAEEWCISRVRHDPLKADAVEPLRALFDRATPLQQGVLARLAHGYDHDLGVRKVRGDAPRAVLRDLIKRGTPAEDKVLADTVKVIETCFVGLHDDFGAMRPTFTEADFDVVNRAFYYTTKEAREQVAPMLLTLLFDGETARQKIDYGIEGRLYRLLTGVDEPARPRPSIYDI